MLAAIALVVGIVLLITRRRTRFKLERLERASRKLNASARVLFHAEKIHGGKFLKIELTGETQIGRVEISHPALLK